LPSAKINPSLYQVLGTAPTASFTDLKRACYRRAKECHPDKFQGDLRKEKGFKQLVHAFDILSDPLKRRRYDIDLKTADNDAAALDESDAARFAAADQSIMDSMSDDILEEMIVGNYVPRNATLQSLMSDLESTDKFLFFREAKNLYYKGRCRQAYKLFSKSVRWSPNNILYHYYLGKAAEHLRLYRKAVKCYRTCMSIGAARNPPQRLLRIQERIHRMRKRDGGLVGKVMTWLSPPDTDGIVNYGEADDRSNQPYHCPARQRDARQR